MIEQMALKAGTSESILGITYPFDEAVIEYLPRGDPLWDQILAGASIMLTSSDKTRVSEALSLYGVAFYPIEDEQPYPFTKIQIEQLRKNIRMVLEENFSDGILDRARRMLGRIEEYEKNVAQP